MANRNALIVCANIHNGQTGPGGLIWGKILANKRISIPRQISLIKVCYFPKLQGLLELLLHRTQLFPHLYGPNIVGKGLGLASKTSKREQETTTAEKSPDVISEYVKMEVSRTKRGFQFSISIHFNHSSIFIIICTLIFNKWVDVARMSASAHT